MTSPVSMGQASVEIVADVKGLFKNIRKEIREAFKDLDLNGAVRDSLGRKPVKVPVKTDTDTSEVGEKVRKTKAPKVAVEVDPLLDAFQRQVRTELNSLARTANANIPVGASTTRLRSELAAQISAIQTQLKAEIPTEPGDKANYEAKLRADLAAVAARVKQTVTVEAKVDVDKNLGGRGSQNSALSGLGRGLQSITGALPIVGRLSSGVADLIGGFQKLGGTSAQAGGQMTGAVVSATGPLGAIVGALVAAAAAAAILSTGMAVAVPVLGAVAAGLVAVAGAAAAIPGALAGAGAAFGALQLGFSGVGDRISAIFNPKKGGGGGGGGGGGEDPASRARRIAGAERAVEAARRGIAAATRGVQSAERGYADAVRGVTEAEARLAKATEAVGKARKQAKEDIEDLGRALRGAVLDEEEAAAALVEAQYALSEAQQSGDLKKIARANVEYKRAQLAIEETADATGDLSEKQAEAAAKGVEGSDLVQDALDDQKQALEGVRQAHEGVIDASDALLSANDGLKASYDGLKSAQDALAEAQKKAASGGGGGGGLADNLPKLAPAAQKFVDAIKRLKPAFDDLRLDVQQRLFAGLDKTVTKLGEAWIPALKTTLGSYADTFNTFFRTLGANISTPQFIGRIQAGAEGARKGLAAIGEAISGPLVEAFGRLSAASAPFLEKTGKVIAGLITDFSTWINRMDQAKLDQFFADAGEAVSDLGVTAKESGRLVGNLFGIIFRQRATGKSGIDSFNDGLRKINEWLEDPKNLAKVDAFIAGVKEKFEEFKKTFGGISDVLAGGEEGKAKVDSLGRDIGKALIAGFVAGVKEQISGSEKPWYAYFSPTAGLVYEIKKLLGINSPSTVMMEVGRNFIAGFIAGIAQKAADLVAAAAQLPGKILGAVGDVTTLLLTKGKQTVTGMITGIGGSIGTLRQKAASLKTTVTGALATAGTWLLTTGRNAVSGLISGISGWLSRVAAAASNIRITVVNALSNAGTWLLPTGKNVVTGLWNGIAGAAGWLWNKVSSFASRYVTGAIKSALGIASPSKVAAQMGRYTTQGLADGMLADARRVEQAAEQIALSAIPDSRALLGTTGVAFDELTAQLHTSIPAPRQIEAAWRPGATGDKILDGLRDLIEWKHRGDPVAALGTR